jgi:WD40 repeat protein/tRNA A-37 threonylcarbamoyl transferase component Bud32
MAAMLQRYLLELEQGGPTDRQRLLAEAPERADELAECLEAIEFLHLATTGTRITDASVDLTPNAGEARLPIGDFRILRELGRGGMGVVYEAEQLSLGRRVALKILPLAALLDPRHVERFRNEARAAAMLKHDHIVSVYSVGCERGIHHYAMELVEGQTLAPFVRRHAEANHPQASTDADTAPLALLSTAGTAGSESIYRSAARLGIQAARALDYAHRSGVIHRDVKPSNLMVDASGKLSVTDFGLARIHAGDELTLTGDVVGTLRYMSPEQVQGHVVDQRTDIYSLGITLYELILGRAAYTGSQRQQLMQQIVEQPLSPLRSVDRSAPRDLETVLAKATAKDPNDRYRSAEWLADDLQRFLDGEPVLAQPASRVRALWKWCRRNPLVAGLSACLLLILVALSIAGPLLALHEAAVTRDIRRHWFVADMNLAYEAWYGGNVDRAEQLLRRQKTVQPTNTGFAQAYLTRLYAESDSNIVYRHPAPIQAMAMSPDGHTVACAGYDCCVVLVDLRSGNVTRRFSGREHWAVSVAFSPDGQTLAVGGLDHKLLLWDQSTWTTRSLSAFDLVDGENISAVRYSPDGSALYVATDLGQLASVRRDGTSHWRIKAHESNIEDIAVSPDGKRIVTVGREKDRTIRLWESATGTMVRQIAKLGVGHLAVTFSPDGKTILAATHERVCYWDIETGVEVRGLEFPVSPTEGLAVSSQGLLATGDYNNRVQVWDFATGRRLDQFDGNRDWIVDVAFTPDGQQLVSAEHSGIVRIHNLDKSYQAQNRVSRYSWFRPAFLSMSADGARLASVGAIWSEAGDNPVDDGELAVWDVATGQIVWQIPVSKRDAHDVALNPYGDWFVTCGAGSIRIWDTRSRDVQHLIADNPNHDYTDAAISPDGHWLAIIGKSRPVSTEERWVTIWDVSSLPPRTAKIIPVSKPFDEYCGAVEFDESNRYLIVSHANWVDGTEGFVELFALRGSQWQSTPVSSTSVGAGTTGVRFVPGTDYWLAWSERGHLSLAKIGQPELFWRVRPGGAYSAAITSDGKQLALGHNRAISLWDMQTVDELATIHTDIWVSSIVFTPDGKTLIWGGGDGSVHFERTE